MTRPVRVLIVDDSPLVRAVLRRELERDPLIAVLAAVADPFAARDVILATPPDVITLDLDMPRMDGLTFLRKLMAQRPIPTVVISSWTAAGSRTAVEALEAGAVDVLAKPGGAYSPADLAGDLADRVKTAALARPARRVGASASPAPATPATDRRGERDGRVWALGASTGGVAALCDVIAAFPADAPPTLIAPFTAGFAARLNALGGVRVKEAQDGDALRPGWALVAPGGRHMTVRRDGGGWCVAIEDGPAPLGVRPSIDRLFESVARVIGCDACCGLLTGMGEDGAAGLLAVRRAGGRTLAQDEATSVVYGMPQAATKYGAAEVVVPLSGVAATFARWSGGRRVA